MNTSEQRPRPERSGQYRFGDFLLDAENGFLRRGSEEVPLQPKAFEVLTFLVERHGRLVTKEELSDAIWGETAVTDNSLSQCLVQIRRALADDSQQMIRTVARRGYVFDAPLTAPVLEFPREADQPASACSSPVSRSRELIWGMLAAALAIAAGIGWFLRPGSEPLPAHFVLSPPEGTRIALRMPTKALISVAPDGKNLVVVAEENTGKRSLWLRPLSSTAYQRLDQTEGASLAFWSPDSRFVAFFADGKLKKVAVSGGPPQTICEVGMGDGEGAAWNQDGAIVFAPPRPEAAARPKGPLSWVPAAGGAVQLATAFDEEAGELSHSWPQFLPDGKHFLYLARNKDPEKSRIYVQELGSPERQTLLISKTQAAYTTGPGGQSYLLFPRDRALLAQPLNLGRLELSGEPFAVAADVNYNTLYGTSAFSVSGNSVLAYRSGIISDGTSPVRQLAWYSRRGDRLRTIGEPGLFSQLALSPDETRVAVDRNMHSNDAQFWDIWTIELASGVFSRLTQGPNFRLPVWSPDSRKIAAVARVGDLREIVEIPIASGPPLC